MREGTAAFLEKRKAGVQGEVACADHRHRRRRRAERPASGSRSSSRGINDFVTRRLQAARAAALASAGAVRADITVVAVPGAFEIPQAAQRAPPKRGRFDAVVCLGCLIRGETPHFEYIASAVAHGIDGGRGGHRRADGVRRADDQHRSRRRWRAPATGHDNKGWEAAAAAIEMASCSVAADTSRSTAGRRA